LAGSVRVLFVGGQPKGHLGAFSPETLSGKRLRRLVDRLGLRVVDYFDLWRDYAEEYRGEVGLSQRVYLRGMQNDGVILVPLGRYVNKRLAEARFHLPYYEHPASRRKGDLKRLEDKLSVFAPIAEVP